MNLEQAITTALEYEARVHQTYAEAVESADHDVAKRVFSTLCEEELGHIKYLRERLDEWRDTGEITVAELDTVLVPKAVIESRAAKLRDSLSGDRRASRGNELESLNRALEVERETSAFYKQMVATLRRARFTSRWSPPSTPTARGSSSASSRSRKATSRSSRRRWIW